MLHLEAEKDHWFGWSEHAMDYYKGAIVAWEKERNADCL